MRYKIHSLYDIAIPILGIYPQAKKQSMSMIYTTIWINLKIITLTKKIQNEKEYILYDSFYMKTDKTKLCCKKP